MFGIGTNNPIAKLQVNHNSNADWSYGIKLEVNRELTKAFTITNTELKEDVFMIWGNGTVNTKTIYAEAVKVRPVTIGTYWPDYVFDDTYKLMSIRELEKFIQTYNHLPDVPTKSDVLENGIDVYEMNVILLKKIEELTLYTIMQQKQINLLINEINIIKQ